MSEATNSLIQATADHLSQFAPFDQMDAENVLWLAQHATLAYFAKGEAVLSPEQSEPVPFVIIKQGIIQGEQGVVGAAEDSAWLELHEGECFPLGALLAGRPVTSVYRASSDTFCYLVPATDFLRLTRLSPAFYDFCTRRIATLLEHSKHLIQAGYSKASTEQQSMSSNLAAVIRREPVTCPPDASIKATLQLMQEHGVGAMVAVEGAVPVGIFTLHDVLDRVVLAEAGLLRSVIDIMSTQLTTLPPHEAALAMAKMGGVEEHQPHADQQTGRNVHLKEAREHNTDAAHLACHIGKRVRLYLADPLTEAGWRATGFTKGGGSLILPSLADGRADGWRIFL